MHIHETIRTPHHDSTPTTAVLVESVANDVAAYWLPGDEAPEHVAAHGFKMTEREARLAGFTIPAGKHYRR